MHEIDLTPNTVLELAPEIRTRRTASGHVLVDSPVETIVDIGPRGFAILSSTMRSVVAGWRGRS